MKRIIATAVLAAMAAGCHTAHIKVEGDGKWEADLYDNFIGRKIEKCSANVQEGGKFIFNLNGYETDTSEQLPAFTKEMWAGLGILGRIAAATVNPTAATVPLTAEPADAEAIAKLQRELAAAKAEVVKAKAEAKAATASATTSAATATACDGGNCETKQ